MKRSLPLFFLLSLHLVAAQAQVGERVQLTKVESAYTSFSPDGSQIAYVKWLGDNGEIFLADREGQNAANLTTHEAFDGWPTWSSDGTRLLFASGRSGSYQLYTMAPDGSNLGQLTHGPGSFTQPRWSRDGTKILSTRTLGGNVDLFMLPSPPGPSGFAFMPVTGERLVEDGGQSRGLAWGDYDNDGDADLYVANTGGQWNFLYRNDGNGAFTKQRGIEVVRHRGFSEGVNWIDYDDDGDLDLFVANTDDWEAHTGDEANFLFRNDADSGFVQVTTGPLVEDRMNSAMACWGDYDNDGLVDAFLVNRADQNDALYHNLGDGHFERIYAGPVVSNGGNGRACAWGDVDNDGDLDLYVGNGRQRNFMYRNDGEGRFVEQTQGDAVTGAAYTYGLSFADFDNDEDLDLMVSNIGRDDRNALYRNDGTGHFERVADNPIVDHVKYQGDGGGASKGHTWGDFDNDGDLDLFVANGTYAPDMRNFFFENQGGGTFIRLRDHPLLAHADTSAGTAWADYDNDGDLDLFVANWGRDDEDNALYRNDTEGGNWLTLRLEGRSTNRFGLGARARVTTTQDGQASWQSRWMLPGTGYASQNEYSLHFGLGTATRVDTLEIHWPSGQIDRYDAVEARHFWIAIEGETLRLDPRRHD